MKTTIALSVGLMLSLILSGLLSSFSLLPATAVSADPPPSQTPRVQQRQQQRLLRLQGRLQRAKHAKHRLRLQKRIQQLQDGERKNWAWAITGFSISALAFILFLTLIAGGISSLGGVILGILGVIVLAILGLIFSIIGVVMPGVNEKFGGRGLAIAGIAIAGAFVMLFLISLLIGTP